MNQHQHAFRSYLENQGMRKNTIDAYARDIKTLSEWMKSQHLHTWQALTAEVLSAFVEFLNASGKSGATVTRHVAAVRRYLRFLNEGGVVADCSDIKGLSIKNERKPLLILTKEEIALILKQADTKSEMGLRDAIMLKMLYETGIKVTEIIALTVEDLDLKRKRVLCNSAYDQRIVYLNLDLVKMLKRYMSLRTCIECGDDAALFVNCYGQGLSRQGLWKMVKTYATACNLSSQVTPHTLRHSFAVHLLQDGGSLRHLQMMMGHQDMTSTQVYENYLLTSKFSAETVDTII